MADITMCGDTRCPSRTLCYRYTAKACQDRQVYFFKSPRAKDAMRCDQFWDNTSNNGNPDPTDVLGF